MPSSSETATLRALGDDDLAAALVLNNAAVPAVNPHNLASLRALVNGADRCWGAQLDGELLGLLVTFAPGGSYDSTNYRWLCERFESFRYVDRIVVSPNAKRRGLGRRFYTELEVSAREAGAERLVCEVNVEPPNPHSIGFHLAAGWLPIEDRVLGVGKTVRYFEKPLT